MLETGTPDARRETLACSNDPAPDKHRKERNSSCRCNTIRIQVRLQKRRGEAQDEDAEEEP